MRITTIYGNMVSIGFHFGCFSDVSWTKTWQNPRKRSPSTSRTADYDWSDEMGYVLASRRTDAGRERSILRLLIAPLPSEVATASESTTSGLNSHSGRYWKVFNVSLWLRRACEASRPASSGHHVTTTVRACVSLLRLSHAIDRLFTCATSLQAAFTSWLP